MFRFKALRHHWPLSIFINVLLYGLLLGLLTSCIRPIATTDAATTDTAAVNAVQPDPTSTPASVAAVSDRPEEIYNGVPVGFTVEGYPYRGSLDAPVTMFEYSDYQCPFCARYFVQTEPAITEAYVRAGTLRVVFRDFPLDSIHPNATAASEAALCIGDQSAAMYWQMHDQLFRSQEEWASQADPSAVFVRLAEEVGADVSLFATCLAEDTKSAIIQAGIDDASALEFGGTPSFRFVNTASGEGWNLVGAQPFDQFAGYVDTIAAGNAPAAAQEDQGGGALPFWASADGLLPDANRPGYNMAGDQYRGNPDATLVVVEFSDFQCPYCSRHTTQTQPILDEQFVATDKVMWVFKHFPLDIHPQGIPAAVAAECAGDQGKFWEMHALLFQDASPWSISEPNPIFSSLAEQLALDIAAFDTCLLSEDAQQRVQSDMSDGAQFMRGTPTFVVVKDGKGVLIPGAIPTEQFTSYLEQVLTSGIQ